jgi:hypothetical protein
VESRRDHFEVSGTGHAGCRGTRSAHRGLAAELATAGLAIVPGAFVAAPAFATEVHVRTGSLGAAGLSLAQHNGVAVKETRAVASKQSESDSFAPTARNEVFDVDSASLRALRMTAPQQIDTQRDGGADTPSSPLTYRGDAPSSRAYTQVNLRVTRPPHPPIRDFPTAISVIEGRS